MRGWIVFLTAAVAMLVLSAGMAQPQTSEPVLDANVPDGDA
jgi:hypothetical protein